MSALAVRTGSVNLGQGFPDQSGPASVVEAAVRRACAAGRNQYPPGRGVPELRRGDRRGTSSATTASTSTPTQVVVTAGATEAIAAACSGWSTRATRWWCCEPYYDCYRATIQIAGGVRRPVTLRAPDFRLDVDELGPRSPTAPG